MSPEYSSRRRENETLAQHRYDLLLLLKTHVWSDYHPAQWDLVLVEQDIASLLAEEVVPLAQPTTSAQDASN